MNGKMYENKICPEWMSYREMADRYEEICCRMREDWELFSDHGLAELIDRAREEEDWRVLRSWLKVIRASGSGLSAEDRNLLLEYLFELLFDDNGEVRRLAAEVTGCLLAVGVALDRSILSKAFHRILFLSGKKSETKKRYIGSALQIILAGLLTYCKEEDRKQIPAVYVNYFKSTRWEKLTCLNLLQGIMDIPADYWSVMQKSYIFEFMRSFLSGTDEEMGIAGLMILRSWLREGWRCPDEIRSYLLTLPVSATAGKRYLMGEIQNILEGKDSGEPNSFFEDCNYEILFRENLKSDDAWVGKVVNLEILNRHFMDAGNENQTDLSVYASHLLHVLRLNSKQEVFARAGDELVDLMPFLKKHQQYQIIQEILKAIEMRDDSTNYIPSFLGRTFLYMDEQNQKDLSLHMKALADRKDADTVKIILETVCVIMEGIPEFAAGHPEMESFLKKEYRFFLGILARSLFSYRKEIAGESLLLAGEYLFNEHEGNADIEGLCEIARRMLILSDSLLNKPVDIGYRNAFLRVSDFMKRIREAGVEEEKKAVAVLSGDFDPFTLSQKALIREVVDMGCYVYVNVHDFYKEEDPVPLLLRRQMAWMTLADLLDVCLLPVDMPLNLMNSEDVITFADKMDGKKVYLIVEDEEEIAPEALGRVFPMIIPPYYSNVPLVDIHEFLESGQDIGNLVDRQVQNMIRERGLYSAEHVSQEMPYAFEGRETGEDDDFFLSRQGEEGPEDPCWHELKEEELEDFDREAADKLAGLMARKPVRIHLPDEKAYQGVLDGENERPLAGRLLLDLSDLLTRIQEKGYEKAVWYEKEGSGSLLRKILPLLGFVELAGSCLVVDLQDPLVIFYDLPSMIHRVYLREERVREALFDAQIRLQKAILALYPGHAVLLFDSDRLSRRIEASIEESLTDELLCIPFGKSIRKLYPVNAITRPLHVEKMYDPALLSFEIKELPDYPDLAAQIRILKSYGRKMVLVDDLYHKGFRMDRLDGLMDQANIRETRLYVGVLSGQGQALAREKNKKVDYIYKVNNMKAWILESDLYPFFGGDGIRTDDRAFEGNNGIPSINGLPPYQYPSYLEGASEEDVYALAMVSLFNARSLVRALEETYMDHCHRVLTLERFHEVVRQVRLPAELAFSAGFRKKKVSDILSMEIQRLKRLSREV